MTEQQEQGGNWQKPSVGSIVHYVSHGSPIREDGTQAFKSECRAAIVTEVTNPTNLKLAVINPTGFFFRGECLFDGADKRGGSWHWPERV